MGLPQQVLHSLIYPFGHLVGLGVIDGREKLFYLYQAAQLFH